MCCENCKDLSKSIDRLRASLDKATSENRTRPHASTYEFKVAGVKVEGDRVVAVLKNEKRRRGL